MPTEQISSQNINRLFIEKYHSLKKPDLNWTKRGIVTCAGGGRYLLNLFVLLKSLRAIDCTLPVECFYLGRSEIDTHILNLFDVERLNVKWVDATELLRKYPHPNLRGWELKPYAIKHSSFNEVLYLDADTFVVKNPSYLFMTQEYLKNGSIFWSDLEKLSPSCALVRYLDLPHLNCQQIESGQILLEKNRVWKELEMTNWLNEHSPFVYKFIHGDKDTFTLAWNKLKTPYHQVKITPPHNYNGTFCHRDVIGDPMFFHWTLNKLTFYPRLEHPLLSEEKLAFIKEQVMIFKTWMLEKPDLENVFYRIEI